MFSYLAGVKLWRMVHGVKALYLLFISAVSLCVYKLAFYEMLKSPNCIPMKTPNLEQNWYLFQ